MIVNVSLEPVSPGAPRVRITITVSADGTGTSFVVEGPAWFARELRDRVIAAYAAASADRTTEGLVVASTGSGEPLPFECECTPSSTDAPVAPVAPCGLRHTGPCRLLVANGE